MQPRTLPVACGPRCQPPSSHLLKRAGETARWQIRTDRKSERETANLSGGSQRKWRLRQRPAGRALRGTTLSKSLGPERRF
jgi:hypothetical protein